MLRDHLIDAVRRWSLDDRCCDAVLLDVLEVMYHILYFHVLMGGTNEWDEDVGCP